MTTPSAELIRELASLKASRKITWTAQTAVNGKFSLTTTRPVSLADGVSVSPNGTSGNVGIYARLPLKPISYHQCIISVDTVNDTDDYDIQFVGGGTTELAEYTSDGSATEGEILAGIKAAIDVIIAAESYDMTTAIVGTTVVVTGGLDCLEWVWTVADGDASLEQTPTTCTAELWALMYGASSWDYIGVYTVTNNSTTWVSLPGVLRASWVVTSVDGTVIPEIGAPIVETWNHGVAR